MSITRKLTKTDLSLLAYLCDQRLVALLEKSSAGSMQESETLHDLAIKLALLTNKEEESLEETVLTIPSDESVPYLDLMTKTLKRLYSLDIVGYITIGVDEFGMDITVLGSEDNSSPYMYAIEFNTIEEQEDPEIVVEGTVYSLVSYEVFLRDKLEDSLKDAFR